MSNRLTYWKGTVDTLADINAGLGGEWIDKLKRPGDRARLLCKLGEIDDALAEIESIDSPYLRALRLAELSDTAPNDMTDEFLETALAAARSVQESDQRVVALRVVAVAFLDSGREEQGVQIDKSAMPSPDSLGLEGFSRYARGRLGSLVTIFDADKGRELMTVGDPAVRLAISEMR